MLQNSQRLSVKSRAQFTAASSPAATAVSTTIVLKQCELSFGDTVKAVGESDLFGSWDSGRAPELQWQEGHDWQAELNVPAGNCSFKVAHPLDTGSALMLPLHDIRLQHAAELMFCLQLKAMCSACFKLEQSA